MLGSSTRQHLVPCFSQGDFTSLASGRWARAYGSSSTRDRRTDFLRPSFVENDVRESLQRAVPKVFRSRGLAISLSSISTRERRRETDKILVDLEENRDSRASQWTVYLCARFANARSSGSALFIPSGCIASVHWQFEVRSVHTNCCFYPFASVSIPIIPIFRLVINSARDLIDGPREDTEEAGVLREVGRMTTAATGPGRRGTN